MKISLVSLLYSSLFLFVEIVAITWGLSVSFAQAVDIETISALKQRPPWTKSTIRGIPDPPPYQTERVYPHLQFERPVVLTKAPGCSRWFVAELAGKIFSFPDDPACSSPDLFIDLAQQIDGVQHVYGMAFHPRFEQHRFVYICYLAGKGFQGDARVSRFKVTETSPPKCDAASEQLLLKWETGGHNGGCLKFGPDGYLYISTGDGASPSPPDPYQAGQNLADLRSSILRIDVDASEPGRLYRIPCDNPFVDREGARPEIWAYGLRNPWRMNFDPVTGDLWLGDVGWESWELVHRIERGGNYGWSVMEGPLPIYPDGLRGPTPISPPIVALPRSQSTSVTGGYVYRGTKYPELVGAYIFGDYDTRRVWATRIADDQHVSTQEIATTDLRLITFGQDERNELFLVDYDRGSLHQLVPRTNAPDAAFPQTLSQTGLFASTREHLPAAGVVPFLVNASQWADQATAERLVALPDDTVISLGAAGKSAPLQQLEFPENSVLVKTLSLEMRHQDPSSRRRIETQILHRSGGEWRGYSYRWNDDQSDATLVGADGEQTRLSIMDPQAPQGRREQFWTFAGRAQCARCHNAGAGYTLAFNLAQLDRPLGPSRQGPNQLQVFEQLGVIQFRSAPLGSATSSPSHTFQPSPRRLVDPYDEAHALEERFRSYLHVNCAHCHQATVGGNSEIDLRAELPLADTKLLDTPPLQGTFGLQNAAIISTADPYRSVLIYRLAKTGRGRMPRGSEVADTAAIKLFYQWHAQLSSRVHPAAAVATPDQAASGTAAIEPSLDSTNGALRLQRRILNEEVSAATRQEAIQAGAHHRDVAIAELFEAFLPPEERPRREPHALEPSQILALPGDPARGRDLFFRTEAVQCQTCHRIGSQGGTLGPDLSTIGRLRDRSHLLQSILEPSREIEPSYLTWVVQTTEGQVHSGFIKSKTDQAIVLRDAQDREFNLPAERVDALQPLPVSLMPELLLQDITAAEIADLLAYLSSLR